jgi:putative ABC transport system permease protein
MNIVNLAIANIRKSKGAAASLVVLIVIATLLLTLGLNIILTFNSFHDDKVEQLHGAHVSTIINSKDYKHPTGEFLQAAKELETESTLMLLGATLYYADSVHTMNIAVLNAHTNRTIAPLKLIDKQDTITNEEDQIVYIPYYLSLNGGYKLGDNLTITYKDKDYSYRVAGFFEATMLGTPNTGMFKFYVPNDDYLQLSDKLESIEAGTVMSATFADPSQASRLLDEYQQQYQREEMGLNSSFSWAMDVEDAKNASSVTINIVAMILVAFAMVIVLVSLIVIKFRVTNSIDDGIVHIGILKAIGYTSKQILASIALQFMLITIFAAVIGVLLSYAVMPVFGGIISSLSGLIWMQGADVGIDLASILIVTLLVLIVTMITALRIGKLHPVAALRGGLLTHSFRRNFFPLELAKGGLHFALACKTMLMNSKQNIMLTMIMVAITFASIFSVVLYYSIAIDKVSFYHLVGAETSNVEVVTKDGTDNHQLIADIEQMDGVDRTATLDYMMLRIDGQNIYTKISEDFSKLANKIAFEGRDPQYDNEIVLSWVVAEQLNKDIGDTVNVELGNAAQTYLITGLSQNMNDFGLTASITIQGVQQLSPEYKSSRINVYLENTDNESFIQAIKNQYGNVIDSVMNIDEILENQGKVYISAVFAVMVIIITITVLVVVLILYLVIKTMIVKRSREFGILKAMGYTTYQLMTQIAMSFVPIVIVGTLVGGILGFLYTNSVLALLLSSGGVHNVQFIVNIPVIVGLCIGLSVLSYLVSMLVSYRIKRVTAYSLITE